MSTPHICPKDHAHGATATCWGNKDHKCRCDECREAQRVRMARRRKNIAYGRHEFTRSATPVRKHIERLRAAKWTVRDIARAAHVSPQTVDRVGLGHSGAIAAESARRILAVDPTRRPNPDKGHQLVDATGTIRRLQALTYMGYSGAELMRRIGANPAYIAHILKHPLVFESTRRNVADLYRELWNKPPRPSNGSEAYMIRRMQKRARDHGWVGPLHWDDIDTDPEPAATPEPDTTTIDEIKVERALNGEKHPLNHAEKREVVRVGHSRRWADTLIALRVGVAVETVARIRVELALPAWPNGELIDRSDAA